MREIEIESAVMIGVVLEMARQCETETEVETDFQIRTMASLVALMM